MLKQVFQKEKIVTLKFGDEDRYEVSNPKVIVVKEFDKENENIENILDKAIGVPVAQINENNEIPNIPAYNIEEPEIKIAAENINKKIDENL